MASQARKVIIELRCNEYAMRDANPHVPWTPEEIARDAAEAREAGAAILHYHAREPETGAPSNDVAAPIPLLAHLEGAEQILDETAKAGRYCQLAQAGGRAYIVYRIESTNQLMAIHAVDENATSWHAKEEIKEIVSYNMSAAQIDGKPGAAYIAGNAVKLVRIAASIFSNWKMDSPPSIHHT